MLHALEYEDINFIRRSKMYFQTEGRVMMDAHPFNGEQIVATVNDIYQYCTGSNIIPLDTANSELEGEERYAIEVEFISCNDPEHPALPTASTCANRITLPITNKKKFNECFKKAMNNRIGFGTA